MMKKYWDYFAVSCFNWYIFLWVTKKNSKERRGVGKKRPRVTFQIDNSTFLSYNNAENKFGYKGVASIAIRDLLDEIELDFAVDIDIQIQPTHTFDFNAQDALYHSGIKRLLRKEEIPRGDIDFNDKFQDAVDKISLNAIQRGFVRAYSRTENWRWLWGLHT